MLTGPSSGLASRSVVVMARRPTARDIERVAAARPPQLRRPPAPPGDALGMLVRRGLRPSLARPDLPFPSDISIATASCGAPAVSAGAGMVCRTRVAPLARFDVATGAKFHARASAAISIWSLRPGEARELWTLGRHLYVMNSRPDLMTNVGRVIAEGLLAQPSAARLKRSAPACEVASAVQTL
jgi:hypothetical protein